MQSVEVQHLRNLSFGPGTMSFGPGTMPLGPGTMPLAPGTTSDDFILSNHFSRLDVNDHCNSSNYGERRTGNKREPDEHDETNCTSTEAVEIDFQPGNVKCSSQTTSDTITPHFPIPLSFPHSSPTHFQSTHIQYPTHSSPTISLLSQSTHIQPPTASYSPSPTSPDQFCHTEQHSIRLNESLNESVDEFIGRGPIRGVSTKPSHDEPTLCSSSAKYLRPSETSVQQPCVDNNTGDPLLTLLPNSSDSFEASQVLNGGYSQQSQPSQMFYCGQQAYNGSSFDVQAVFQNSEYTNIHPQSGYELGPRPQIVQNGELPSGAIVHNIGHYFENQPRAYGLQNGYGPAMIPMLENRQQGFHDDFSQRYVKQSAREHFEKIEEEEKKTKRTGATDRRKKVTQTMKQYSNSVNETCSRRPQVMQPEEQQQQRNNFVPERIMQQLQEAEPQLVYNHVLQSQGTEPLQSHHFRQQQQQHHQPPQQQDLQQQHNQFVTQQPQLQQEYIQFTPQERRRQQQHKQLMQQVVGAILSPQDIAPMQFGSTLSETGRIFNDLTSLTLSGGHQLDPEMIMNNIRFAKTSTTSTTATTSTEATTASESFPNPVRRLSMPGRFPASQFVNSFRRPTSPQANASEIPRNVIQNFDIPTAGAVEHETAQNLFDINSYGTHFDKIDIPKGAMPKHRHQILNPLTNGDSCDLKTYLQHADNGLADDGFVDAAGQQHAYPFLDQQNGGDLQPYPDIKGPMGAGQHLSYSSLWTEQNASSASSSSSGFQQRLCDDNGNSVASMSTAEAHVIECLKLNGDENYGFNNNCNNNNSHNSNKSNNYNNNNTGSNNYNNNNTGSNSGSRNNSNFGKFNTADLVHATQNGWTYVPDNCLLPTAAVFNSAANTVGYNNAANSVAYNIANQNAIYNHGESSASVSDNLHYNNYYENDSSSATEGSPSSCELNLDDLVEYVNSDQNHPLVPFHADVSNIAPQSGADTLSLSEADSGVAQLRQLLSIDHPAQLELNVPKEVGDDRYIIQMLNAYEVADEVAEFHNGKRTVGEPSFSVELSRGVEYENINGPESSSLRHDFYAYAAPGSLGGQLCSGSSSQNCPVVDQEENLPGRFLHAAGSSAHEGNRFTAQRQAERLVACSTLSPAQSSYHRRQHNSDTSNSDSNGGLALQETLSPDSQTVFSSNSSPSAESQRCPSVAGSTGSVESACPRVRIQNYPGRAVGRTPADPDSLITERHRTLSSISDRSVIYAQNESPPLRETSVDECPTPEERAKERKANMAVASRRAADLSVAELFETDEHGDIKLHDAALHEDCCWMEALLKRYEREGRISDVINARNNNGQIPLSVAVIVNKPDIVEALLEYNPDVNIPLRKQQGDRMGVKYEQLIHFAASRGQNWLRTLTKLLKAKDVDINALNSEGKTAAHCAIEAHRKVPAIGQDAGQRMELIDSKPILTVLSDHDADLNKPDGTSAKTPLHYAIEKRDVDLVMRLLSLAASSKDQKKNGVSQLLSAQTGTGDTALHLAVSMKMDIKEHRRLVQMLLSRGADPSSKNAEGQLPREVARNEEIVELLKGKGTGRSTAR